MASWSATVLGGVVVVAASAAIMAGCVLDLESLTQGAGEDGGGVAGFGACGGAGCSRPCEVARGIIPHALALDGGKLYASSAEQSFIARVDLATGTVEKFVTQVSSPEAITIAAGHLVWADANGVWTCPLGSTDCNKDKAALYKLGEGKRVRGLAADEDTAFFVEDYEVAPAGGRILRCAVAAGCSLTPKEIAAAQAHPSGLALSGDMVFWTQTGSSPEMGRVSRAPKAGGTQEDIAAKLVLPGSITVFSDQVLWTEATEGDTWPGGVFRCPTTSSTCTPELVVSGAGQPESGRIDDPVGVLSDGKRVYFANLGAGTLMSCEYPSCVARPKVLFADMDQPRGTALGESCVYVTDRSSSGRIIAVPK